MGLTLTNGPAIVTPRLSHPDIIHQPEPIIPTELSPAGQHETPLRMIQRIVCD